MLQLGQEEKKKGVIINLLIRYSSTPFLKKSASHRIFVMFKFTKDLIEGSFHFVVKNVFDKN